MFNQNFITHPQFLYSQDVELFKKFRLNYYCKFKYLNHNYIENSFFNEFKSNYLERFSFIYNLNKLKATKSEIFIVTTTFNRAQSIEKLFFSILNQKFSGEICWILVDNGSTDNTHQLISDYRNDLNIIYLKYFNPFGYASPGRNRGLAFVQLALKNCIGLKYYWVIDSDDYIHNEYVIKELYAISKRYKPVVAHGFTITNYENSEGKIIAQNTIPRSLSSSFPLVSTLKEEFDTGPQNLSAIIDCKYLPYFYYPNEFTMEDDTLNQRIMTYCMKNNLKIIHTEYPCLVKKFHLNSMSGINNNIGDQNISMELGPMTVKGIRAQVVIGLKYLQDYFTREGV